MMGATYVDRTVTWFKQWERLHSASQDEVAQKLNEHWRRGIVHLGEFKAVTKEMLPDWTVALEYDGYPIVWRGEGYYILKGEKWVRRPNRPIESLRVHFETAWLSKSMLGHKLFKRS